MKCRMCLHEDTLELIHVIKKDDIIRKYREAFGIDTSEYVHENISLMRCQHCGALLYYPPAAGDTEFYKALQKNEWYYMDDKWEYHEAAHYLTKGGNVLEIGAGKGAFAKFVYPGGVSYTGLEYSPDAVKMAEANGVHIINELIEEHSRKHAGEYQTVCHFQVMEHIDDLHSFLSSAVRCLSDDGSLLISVPNADSYLSYLEDDILNMPPHHMSLWDNRALSGIANEFGLDLIHLSYEPLAKVHYDAYLNTLCRIGMGIPKQEIRFSKWPFMARVHRKLLFRLAGPVLYKAFEKEFMRPRGNSLLAVYRKIS